MARISGQSTSSSLLSDLGTHVRARRTQRGMSQEALADEAGIDRSHMGKIERGERNVTLLNIERIAVALQSSVADLVRPDVANSLTAHVDRGKPRTAMVRAPTQRPRISKARFDRADPRFLIVEFEVYPVILREHVTHGHYSESLATFPPTVRDEFERCLKRWKLAALASDKPGSSDWILGDLYRVTNVNIGNELTLELGPIERRLEEYWF